MNHESTGDCALSAQRGEAAPTVELKVLNEHFNHLQENITLAVNSEDIRFRRAIRSNLRNIARLFDIPVSGED